MSSPPEKELMSLLLSDIIPQLKVGALDCILGLAATDNGIDKLLKEEKFLATLSALMFADSNEIVKRVLKCFVNLTASESFVNQLLDGESDIITRLIHLTCSKVDQAPLASMILSNVTRQKRASELVLSRLEDCGGLRQFVDLLCIGKPHSSYHHVASVMANLTQIDHGRQLLMDQKEPQINRLLPFTTYMESATRRVGIVGTIRNCCFDTAYHKILFYDNLCLLSYLLLPLAGPEEFDEDEMDKLPLELQYLEEHKQRDPNPEVRKMLLEALTQLCAKTEGRQLMREKNVYLVLRELHKWEKSTPVIVACENLVDILIGDEPQPGMENLKEVEVPHDMTEKFHRMDEELLKIS